MRKDPNTDPEDGFLSRWSRRKRENSSTAESADAVQEETIQQTTPAPVTGRMNTAPPEANAVAPVEADDQVQEEESTTERVLTDEDMPSIESLKEGDDFSPFMSPGVSQELRKLALRKLFSAATFNVRDGLDDYDDDFRSFAALGDIITSDMKHQKEMWEKRKREEEERLAQQSMDEDVEEIEEFSEHEDQVEEQSDPEQHLDDQSSTQSELASSKDESQQTDTQESDSTKDSNTATDSDSRV